MYVLNRISLWIYLAYAGAVSPKKSVQKRQPRRLLEAPPPAWKEWDRAAKLEGISWSAFARRAQLQRVASIDELARAAVDEPSLRERVPGLVLSEKPTPKKRVSTRAKKRLRAGASGKGSSRT